ncbi:hypothetical protein GCM10011342_20690 [Aquisalinus flavus]|uniref:fructose-bisphosphatase n=1 Tax=Aquisalinus flavus TaxID=1526572 RepID=A0A8J2V7M9_9PROT|nr:fructose-bisphosphatase class II [Aquisalinus flavus]GGD11760.1 hypothetical protein GCM10011342_20690 [Aquisalinus flavus]
MSDTYLDRHLTIELGRCTEAAAIAASTMIGRGDKERADEAAVSALRNALNKLAINGTIVIGEGERDEAPMLYIGETVGSGGVAVDIALDPLEGTTLAAKAMNNALVVVAMATKGGLLHSPDVYMAIQMKDLHGGLRSARSVSILTCSPICPHRAVEFSGVFAGAGY